jgi:hypothetical protein
MSQPWQLARAYKPRKSTRPILEQLPAVSTTELHISSIYRGKPAAIKPLKISRIESVKVSLTRVDFHFQSLHRGQRGRTETFRLKPIRTGFGTFRYAFLCNTCGKPVTRLYFHNHALLCRYCCGNKYASQAITPKNRPVLQASRLQAFLDSRPKLKHARKQLEQRLGLKLMQAQSRFSTRTTPQD